MCYICGRHIEELQLDFRDMKTRPCAVCEEAIQECIDGYPKIKNDEEEDEDDVEVMPWDDDDIEVVLEDTARNYWREDFGTT